MRGRERPDQQIGYSNREHSNSFFLVEFLPHNNGNLIETVAALLEASVSKIASGRGADVRILCFYTQRFFHCVRLIFSLFHFALPA